MRRLVLGLLLLWAATCSNAHKCLHDAVFNASKVILSPQAYHSSASRATQAIPTADTSSPLRLWIDQTYLDNDDLGMTCYARGQQVSSVLQSGPYTCADADVVTLNLKGYLSTLLAQAKELFQGTLKVIPVNGNLVLQGSSRAQGLYGGVYLSSDYTETGIPDTDMIIFVTARPIIQSDGSGTQTLAVATIVQQDQNKRPIFGHLNINPAGVSQNAIYLAMNYGVVIHEMTHSLGFSINKFKDINAQPGQPTDITRKVTLNIGAGDAPEERTMIVSPRVVAWAQRYYGCSSLVGVELEDQGGSGTNGSHWEKRTTMNEYMTGTASRNPVFSELTLSLLEDTGWYVANYSMAGQLLWGQGMGCSFTSRSCPNWPKYNGYFCTDNNNQGCSADYQGKGACQLDTYTQALPAEYQYFSDPFKGGYQELPDYCPITWVYDDQWCFDPKAKNQLVDMGESFSQNARCFGSTLVKGLPIGGSSSQGCYDTYCTGPKELRVKIGGYWYLCPQGSDIKIIGYGGTLSCPSRLSQICGSENGTLPGSGVYGDNAWPVFTAISPNSGGSGLKVTITGANFVAGTQVIIGESDSSKLTSVEVLSATTITGITPTSDTFKNPANILDQAVSVIIIDPKGRSTVGYNKFTIKVKINKDFFKNAADYLKNNWLVTAAIVVAIVVSCLVCCYCCYRQKGKAEEADTEYYE